MTDASVVPFGKYKGQPAEVLLADDQYRDWLLAQPWFKDKFANIYNLVINYGGPPQDSPEHNEMQAQFLNHDVCLTVARTLGMPTMGDLLEEFEATKQYQKYRRWTQLVTSSPAVTYLRFEDDGWDVTFGVYLSATVTWGDGQPNCTCGPCDHSACVRREGHLCECNSCDHNPCQVREYLYSRCAHRGHDRSQRDAVSHCDERCFWHSLKNWEWLREPRTVSYVLAVEVELKPDIGDDYPSVLRQVLNYPQRADVRCVIARRARFERVTLADVKKVFRSRHLRLIADSDLIGAEIGCACTECVSETAS